MSPHLSVRQALPSSRPRPAPPPLLSNLRCPGKTACPQLHEGDPLAKAPAVPFVSHSSLHVGPSRCMLLATGDRLCGLAHPSYWAKHMTTNAMGTYMYTHAPSHFLWDLLSLLANKAFSCPSCAVQWLTTRKFFLTLSHSGLTLVSWCPSFRGRMKWTGGPQSSFLPQ